MYQSGDESSYYPPLARAPINNFYRHLLPLISHSLATTTPDLELPQRNRTYGYLRHLLTSYQEVFRPELCQTPMAPDKHGIHHCIKTMGPPVFAISDVWHWIDWQPPNKRLPKCKECSPGPCRDYRRLNMQTEPDHYHLPKITDVASYLHKAKVFSTLNLLKSLVVWYDKCTIGANKVLYLWQCIPPEGFHPLPEKVAAVQSFPSPSTVKALQEFLGMINY
ncbi:uncharacterized protein [Palaemon carinicauda]|uniref:uncharacterized protein n=1 Tax=Palaemon carinicauda TaxID=392227 RepID=UPI0035B64E82